MRQIEIAPSELVLDPEIQTRARGIVKTVVEQYTEAMLRGDKFPPVDAFEVDGKLLVADGFHRVHAALRAKSTTIPCNVHEGSKRNAILFAVTTNAKHGLRRTTADKYRSVELLLRDEEWRARSIRWISDQCGVSADLVRTVQARLKLSAPATPVRQVKGVWSTAGVTEANKRRGIDRICKLAETMSFEEICNTCGEPPKVIRERIANARAAGRDINIDVSPITGTGYVPKPPRGPTDKPHYIPEGHELGGVSRLTDAQGNPLEEWSKTRIAGADKPPVPVPDSFLLDRASVMKRGDGSTVVEWSSYKRDAVARWEAIKEAVAEHVTEYVRPTSPIEMPASTDADRLVAYPIGDPHIGMLAWANEVGESFDLRIAERELCRCMIELVERSPASKEAIVVNLGDFWHAQDDAQRTPKDGNKLDVDGRSGKVGRVGLSIFRSIVDSCLTKHERVRVRSIPGNHDPNSAFWLPIYLSAVYRNEPRVTVEEGFNPYQYDVFGNVLLGWAHGDGAKLDELGEIMATDEPEKWGAAAFRYWNTGHVHHWSQKELRGCVVDTHRTLAGRDAWHHHSGYRSGRALKAVTYHRLYGLDSVAIVGIERVRAALAVK